MKPYELTRLVVAGIDLFRENVRRGLSLDEARDRAAREVCKAEIDRQIKEHAHEVERRIVGQKAEREPATSRGRFVLGPMSDAVRKSQCARARRSESPCEYGSDPCPSCRVSWGMK